MWEGPEAPIEVRDVGMVGRASKDLVEDRKEVGEGTHRGLRRHGFQEAARRPQDEGGTDDGKREIASVKLSSEATIGGPCASGRAGQGAEEGEGGCDVVVAAHEGSLPRRALASRSLS